MPHDREALLYSQLDHFLINILGLPSSASSQNLSVTSLLNFKATLANINNLITMKLTLGLSNWVADTFQLSSSVRNEMRRTILESNPNSNGFDIWLGYPLSFVGEVKCNIPIKGGNKYGAQQRTGIISDIDSLLVGKRKGRLITENIFKFIAFLDLPEIRAANDHLLKTNKELSQKLVFLEEDEIPCDVKHVYGVYIKL